MSSGFVIPSRNQKGLPNNVLDYGQSGLTFTSSVGYQRITDFSDLGLKALNDQLEQLWLRTRERNTESGDYSTTALMVDTELANPTVAGRKLYSEILEVRYVSNKGNDAYHGLTQEQPFRTILAAVQSLPVICSKGAVIYAGLNGNGQYQEQLLMELPFCGELSIIAQQRIVLVGRIKVGSMVRGNIRFENFEFQGLGGELVNQQSPGAAVVFDRCSFVMPGTGCIGIRTAGGSTAALNCGFFGCGDSAMEVEQMGRALLYNGNGSENGTAMKATDGGQGRLQGTRPSATSPSVVQTGGVVEGTATVSAGTSIASLGYSELKFDSIRTMSALDLEFLSDPSPAQGKDRITGKEYKGFWVFDAQDIIMQLSGKTVVGGKLRIKRRAGAGTKGKVKVYLYLHDHEAGAGDAVVAGALGNVAALAPEEATWITLTPASINLIKNGYAKGYAVYSPVSGEELEFYPQEEFTAQLWVIYR